MQGSGKTHTMLGPVSSLLDPSSPHRGIIPRLVYALFAAIEEKKSNEAVQVEIAVESLEIYNGQQTRLAMGSLGRGEGTGDGG